MENLEKLNKINVLIERLKVRRKSIEDTCIKMFGLNEDGRILATDNLIERHRNTNYLINRLRFFYKKNI